MGQTVLEWAKHVSTVLEWVKHVSTVLEWAKHVSTVFEWVKHVSTVFEWVKHFYNSIYEFIPLNCVKAACNMHMTILINTLFSEDNS